MWDDSQMPKKGQGIEINKKEEETVEMILQEQNLVNNKLLQQLMAQQGILTLMLAKLCEKNGIDLNDIVEEMKKGIDKAKEK